MTRKQLMSNGEELPQQLSLSTSSKEASRFVSFNEALLVAPGLVQL